MSEQDSEATIRNREIAESTRKALIRTAIDAYEEAGMSGLCAEGRWEVAIGAIKAFDISAIVGATDETSR